MPKSIQVSIFQINCEDTVKFLANKYERICELLKEIIAKRAKSQSTELFKKLKEIKDKIKNKPDNIEKLTEITDYMEVVPVELEKIKKDINQSMSIYKIMESF